MAVCAGSCFIGALLSWRKTMTLTEQALTEQARKLARRKLAEAVELARDARRAAWQIEHDGWRDPRTGRTAKLEISEQAMRNARYWRRMLADLETGNYDRA
jgi:hypothetical protein